jgi:Protein of unknown function (DUF3305)
MTARVRIPVGVVVERRKAASQWIEHTWRAVAVLVGEPAARSWTMLHEDAEGATFYAGRAEVELHPSETSNYCDNLSTGHPKLWVVLRPTGAEPPLEIVGVTADGSEGEGFTAAGNDIVEDVPMPEPIWNAIDAFVAEHHVERPFYKRKRNHVDTDTPGRRGIIGEDGE